MSLQRRWARLRAALFGYFWLPCPSCGREFGGHEVGNTAGHYGGIPDPEDRWSARLICPMCTASGVGCIAHAEAGMWHSDCRFTTPPGRTELLADYFRGRHKLPPSERVVIVGPGEWWV